MTQKTKLKLATYEKALEYQRIGNRAVRQAREENRRFGLPNIYSRDGVIIYEMPDGESVVKNSAKNERDDSNSESKTSSCDNPRSDDDSPINS